MVKDFKREEYFINFVVGTTIVRKVFGSVLMASNFIE
jgi:hypothetical protein